MSMQIVLIEDDATIREGYAYLINSFPGHDVVGKYASYELSAKHLEALNPDVVLLDIELPGINGIEAILKIKKVLPDVAIIMLTVYEDEQNIFKALVNGAAGYLTKNEPADKIIASLKEVKEGGGPMSAAVAKLVINSFQRNHDSPLSARETEILEHISKGKSRRQIAGELFIDGETVKSHIRNIYMKLDVHSKAEAIKTARENKFI